MCCIPRAQLFPGPALRPCRVCWRFRRERREDDPRLPVPYRQLVVQILATISDVIRGNISRKLENFPDKKRKIEIVNIVPLVYWNTNSIYSLKELGVLIIEIIKIVR